MRAHQDVGTLLIAVTILSAGIACDGAGDLPRWATHGTAVVPEARKTALNDHGLALGQRIAPVTLSCSDGRQHVVADSAETQLVTIATLRDCSECETHMSGLNDLRARGKLPAPDMLVIWPTLGAPASEFNKRMRKSARLVCADEGGVLWDRYNVLHTPVTLVLRSGRVSYIYDAPLQSVGAQQALLADLDTLWKSNHRPPPPYAQP